MSFRFFVRFRVGPAANRNGAKKRCVETVRKRFWGDLETDKQNGFGKFQKGCRGDTPPLETAWKRDGNGEKSVTVREAANTRAKIIAMGTVKKRYSFFPIPSQKRKHGARSQQKETTLGSLPN